MIEVRKFVTIKEEIFHEGGPVAAKPLLRGVLHEVAAFVAAVAGAILQESL